ncbi:MAG: sulfotransferase family protein [Chloroflexota bacterium]
MTIKVIGAGFGRTGTMSLQAALIELGFDSSYHMREVILHGGHGQFWLDAIDHAPTAEEWQTFLADYQSTTDWPPCSFYKELMAVYPEAKVVLTVRDPERWYESTYNTVYQIPSSLLMRLLKPVLPRLRTMYRMVDKLIWDGTFGGRFEDKQHAIDVFNLHNVEVQATVPPERLLVFEVKEGWQPLCEFLGVDVPDKPFPRLNDRKLMENAMFWGPIILIGGVLVGLAGTIGGLIFLL